MHVSKAAGAAALVCTLATLGPSCSKNQGAPASAGPASVTFPATFLWGSATAAFQVEANDANTDWSVWAATSGKISHGDSPNTGGPDALNHFDDDIAQLVLSHQNAYRFSVEWARIYPTLADLVNDTPDPAGIGVYETLLTKLIAAHLTPVVTLHHFATPSYLSDPTNGQAPQAWERPEMATYFPLFCKQMAARWADKVDWWVTINEPVNLALGGYLQGSFPPGQLLASNRMLTVVKAEARAHAAAFDAIHAADTVDADGDGTAARVSLASHQRTFHPLDPTSADDIAAAAHVEYVFNDWFLNAVVRGDWDDDFDGTLTGPNDIKADTTLVGRADYIGVNYYSDTLVSTSDGLILPVINAAVQEADMPTPRPKTDFGWDIYPEGLGTVLDKVAAYGKPIVITENGIADAVDQNRGRFLLEHLYQVGWAMDRKVPVLGYFHWALIDNFEWANGYCPHFGLMAYDKQTGARTPRRSMGTYSNIITSRSVTTAQIAAAAPYVSVPASTNCE